MPSAPEILVSKVPQMEALTSPVRHQIHLVMEMLGACSVNELAERMGRVPETLYYHVRRLEKVGILEQVGSRIVSGREEAMYQLKGKRLRIDPNQSSPRFIKARAKGCGALLRFAQRAFVRAIERKSKRPLLPRHGLRIGQVTVRLSAANLAKLNERLDSLEDFLAETDEPGGKNMYVITFATAPM